MRFLFTVYGSRPHLYPLVPLAWACRAAGHDVRLVSTPRFADDLVQTGLPAVGLGRGPDVSPQARRELAATVYSQPPWAVDWALHLDLLDARQRDYHHLVGRYLIAIAAGMTEELIAFARDWRPDLVVFDTFSYAGLVAATALGIPSVRHLCGTDSVQRLEFSLTDGAPLVEYAQLFEPIRRRVLTEATVTVDPTPPSMRLRTSPPDLDMRYIPHNGPGVMPSGLTGRPRRPRVCITWGSTATDAIGPTAADPYRQTIDAVAALGVDSIIATSAGQIDRLGSLPASARALGPVPLHLVLPYCDAIVHQGGDGTTLTAAALGLPQLVISATPEEGLTGGRLAATGAGIQMWRQDLHHDASSSDAVGDAVDKLLSDSSYPQAAARLRTEIESLPTPADIVPALVALVPDTRARW